MFTLNFISVNSFSIPYLFSIHFYFDAPKSYSWFKKKNKAISSISIVKHRKDIISIPFVFILTKQSHEMRINISWQFCRPYFWETLSKHVFKRYKVN